ncbi:MAG: hypothetical protein OXU73_01875 [Candidatus Campbellbacteria bacterium]|nr:hypothetical protein [Candidatus Campbellbacteria bacterium]
METEGVLITTVRVPTLTRTIKMDLEGWSDSVSGKVSSLRKRLNEIERYAKNPFCDIYKIYKEDIDDARSNLDKAFALFKETEGCLKNYFFPFVGESLRADKTSEILLKVENDISSFESRVFKKR